jgi:membrane protease YdiL (CAAX protease family)
MKFWQWKCLCPKTECPRHGNHQECKTYHAQKNDLPFCKRGKTWTLEETKMATFQTGKHNDSSKEMKSTWAKSPAFFVLVFLFSIPFYVLAPLSSTFIPEGLPINHLGFLMIITPITAAFILTYKQGGFTAAKTLLKKSLDYKKIPRKWYFAIFFLLPLVFLSSMGLMTLIGVQFPAISLPLMLLPILFALFVIFAICEEVGWQGYAFSLLENRHSIFKASIILGAVWAIWHFPLFVIQNPPGGLIWIFGQFTNLILTRILIVWIFTNTARSVSAGILFHAIYNLITMVLPIYSSPIGPQVCNLIMLLSIGLISYFQVKPYHIFETKKRFLVLKDKIIKSKNTADKENCKLKRHNNP